MLLSVVVVGLCCDLLPGKCLACLVAFSSMLLLLSLSVFAFNISLDMSIPVAVALLLLLWLLFWSLL